MTWDMLIVGLVLGFFAPYGFWKAVKYMPPPVDHSPFHFAPPPPHPSLPFPAEDVKVTEKIEEIMDPSWDVERPAKPELIWSEYLGRWALPGEDASALTIKTLRAQMKSVERLVIDNMLLIYSKDQPASRLPNIFVKSEGMLWVQARDGDIRATVWELMDDGRWVRIGRAGEDETVRYALMERKDTLLSVTAISATGMPKFTKSLKKYQQNGDPKKSTLSKDMQEWMDKLTPDAHEALCRVLDITDDIRVKDTTPGRRRIDLED